MGPDGTMHVNDDGERNMKQQSPVHDTTGSMAERTDGHAQAPKRLHGHKNWEAGNGRPGRPARIFSRLLLHLPPLRGSVAGHGGMHQDDHQGVYENMRRRALLTLLP